MGNPEKLSGHLASVRPLPDGSKEHDGNQKAQAAGQRHQTTDSMKLYARWIFSSATPSTAQFVVISGR